MDGVFSVAEVIRYLGDVLAEDVVLSGLWVQGEVSNLVHSAAGHTYLTLKDADCQLRCVIFRAGGAHKQHVKTLKNGDNVIAHGRVGVYEAQGSVQLYIDHVQAAGAGILNQRFEELCARLRVEGLFDEARKRPLPALPRRVGVVTSAQAAAFHDICRILANRFPAVEVVLSPTLVQGVEAPAQIVAAIEHLSGMGDIDVIIVARGGGSIEDLWAFNDEIVARAIFAAGVPVVTGVGHETDFTVADFVADVRAPTPSAAAMAVVPDRDVLLAQIDSLLEDLTRFADERRNGWSVALAGVQRDLQYRSPIRRIAQVRQQVDEQVTILVERIQSIVELQRERLHGRRVELSLLGPFEALRRGYGIVLDARGNLVRDAASLRPDEMMTMRLRDGTVAARVTGVELAVSDDAKGP